MPITIEQAALVLGAAAALHLTPGADMRFCLAQAARETGPRRVARLAPALGAAAGAGGQIVLAAIALGAFLRANPTVAALIRDAGALWLVVVAALALREALRPAPPRSPEEEPLRPLMALIEAAGLALASPRAALTAAALLPQIDAAQGPGLLPLGLWLAGAVAAAFIGASLAARRLRAAAARSDALRRLGAVAAAAYFAGMAGAALL